MAAANPVFKHFPPLSSLFNETLEYLLIIYYFGCWMIDYSTSHLIFK